MRRFSFKRPHNSRLTPWKASSHISTPPPLEKNLVINYGTIAGDPRHHRNLPLWLNGTNATFKIGEDTNSYEVKPAGEKRPKTPSEFKLHLDHKSRHNAFDDCLKAFKTIDNGKESISLRSYLLDATAAALHNKDLCNYKAIRLGKGLKKDYYFTTDGEQQRDLPFWRWKSCLFSSSFHALQV
jgi:hypothetical protein